MEEENNYRIKQRNKSKDYYKFKKSNRKIKKKII